MDANMDRTTLIVGDLHLKQESLFPLIDGAIEYAGVTDVILCGDYMVRLGRPLLAHRMD